MGNNTNQNHIPTQSIIAKLDKAYDKNDMQGAERITKFWIDEAQAVGDKRGELTVLNEAIGIYRKLAKKDDGLRVCKRTLELLDELKMENTISGSTILLNVATCFVSFSECEKGIELFLKVEKIYDNELDELDERKAGFYNNFATAFSSLGDKENATKYFYKALGITEKIENSENETAITYINLADLYMDEDIDFASECVEKGLEKLNSPSVKHNGYHAFVCQKCLPVVERTGYFFAAEELEKRIKNIYERN